MMKNCTLLRLVFIVFSMMVVQNMFAQQITYESIDWIDQYGEHRGPRPDRARYESITFTNQGYAIRHMGQITLRYKFAMTQNGTHYYYLATNDMLSGREFINYQSALIVTTDFQTMNLVNMDSGGKPIVTDVYKRLN